jgi:chromosome condensin MukBEF MukE localization factor
MERRTFNYEWNSREIREAINEGFQLICPRCNADLEVATTPEMAREKKLRTGVFCPKNENHVAVLIEFKEQYDEIWRRYEERKQRAEEVINIESEQ